MSTNQLILQKASAGSGKTYALARQYLVYLLTYTDPESGLKRLRTAPELEDAARHILAITFTNKATAEMKSRIVDRLADLANINLSVNDTDYLTEIMAETGGDEHAVRQTAGTALSILLNNYSDFNVSTIDAFFQTILRTFAYEIGLNDTYSLEMDGNFIATSSVDATLTDVNTAGNDNKNLHKWLSILMTGMADNKNNQWNLFNKSKNKYSLYSQIVEAVRKMSSEEFKEKRRALTEFYSSHEKSYDEFKEIENHFFSPLRDALKKGQEAARRGLKFLPLIESGELGKYTKSRFSKMAAATIFTPSIFSCSDTPEKARTTVFKKEINPDSSPEHTAVADAFVEMLEAKNQLESLKEQPAFKLWMLYRENMKYLPLMIQAAEKSVAMLSDNNVVDISETNSILQRVIGDDDAPFVYERLGSRLNHYLIDEFQDTSKMQWKILKPLVAESLSRTNSNLIIGDAKQSIYRFRNADPSLIISTVAGEDFPEHAEIRGNSVKENTNWRSLRTIVETNNSIFYHLARHLDSLNTEGSDRDNYFATLYANTAQNTNKKEREGYFSLQFKNQEKKEDEDSYNFSEIPELIVSLRKRGYRYSDIAILVRKNSTGRDMVDAIRQFNSAHPGDAIPVVSEDSLYINSATSVKIIVSVLRLMAEGMLTRQDDDDDELQESKWHDESPSRSHRERISLTLFECLYQLSAMSNPGASPQTIIDNMKDSEQVLRESLLSMNSLSLPSFVETIVRKFLTQSQRDNDAPFIAAFQDIVLDYCERYPSDISSFLKWWDVKGEKASISSPDGLDAVVVVTVHKSKGLEYNCVIIPNLKESINPENTEWLWVKSEINSLHLPDKLKSFVPDTIPVETTPIMDSTPHKAEYQEYLRQVRMDVINTWYVAFTRAVAELYVFSYAGHKSSNVADIVANTLADLAKGEIENTEFGIDPNLINVATETIEKKSNSKKKTGGTAEKIEQISEISIGLPLMHEQIEKLRGKKKEEDIRTETIERYFVSNPDRVLHYRDPDKGYTNTTDPDPRSIGNKLHDVMAGIATVEDVDRAVMQRMVSGFLTRKEAAEAKKMIKEKLSQPAVANWFRKGLRVINERSLLDFGDPYMRRPDRIVVDELGHATVIDYKFGTHRDDKAYTRQVKRYMKQLRESGRFAIVKGAIWYVMLDEIITI